jgi:hypothetical protein
LYEEVKAGHLIVTKAGRRSIVLLDDALAWLTKLPRRHRHPLEARGVWHDKQAHE